MAAVAGMTMPPDERRSPASVSDSHRMRSWSILIGVLSDPVLTGASPGRHRVILRITTISAITPTTAPAVFRMLSVRGSPVVVST